MKLFRVTVIRERQKGKREHTAPVRVVLAESLTDAFKKALLDDRIHGTPVAISGLELTAGVITWTYHGYKSSEIDPLDRERLKTIQESP